MDVIGYYILESIAVIGYFRCELCTRSIYFLVDGCIFVVPPLPLDAQRTCLFCLRVNTGLVEREITHIKIA
jgi:hypothetical protein